MHLPRHVDPVVLARYLSGETSEAESALVRAWLASVPARQVEFDAVQRAWELAARPEPAADTSDAWRLVARRMHDSGYGAERFRDHQQHQAPHLSEKTSSQPQSRRPVFDRGGWITLHAGWSRRSILSAGIVASAALIGVSVAALHSWGIFNPKPAVTVSRETREYTTIRGQRATIDDGTTLVLAPGSRLRYVYPTSGAGVRDAYLVGEALFSVAHDTARPFVVHAKNTTTLDIGTTFGVRAFEESSLRVVVVEGRVALGADANHLRPGNDSGRALQSVSDPASYPRLVANGITMLQAGDVASRAQDGVTTVSRDKDIGALLGWTEGKLAFDGVPLREAIPVLERWYDLDIQLARPSLAGRPFTATFTTEPVTQVLNRIALALDMRVERDGRSVVFSAGK